MYAEEKYNTGALNLLRIEKLMIISALKRCRFKKKAAKKLGITINSLAYKIRKHNIK